MTGSAQVLLNELIDYAGLFPPAGLDMETAVANYARYRDGEHAWMLGRFVVPAARLCEFERVASALWGDREPAPPWPVSVLGGADLDAAMKSISEFQATCEGALVDSLELKIDSAEEISATAAQIPAGIAAYFEIPASSDPHACLAALAARGGRAKIRTGGLAAEAFLNPRELATFVITCAALGVPFKATAGLHHLVRGVYSLSYEPDAACCRMHGFLNVLMAATFAHSGMAGVEDLISILEEQSPTAFYFDTAGVVWRDWRIAAEQIRNARTNLAVAFGSCSFEEPVAELQASGLL